MRSLPSSIRTLTTTHPKRSIGLVLVVVVGGSLALYLTRSDTTDTPTEARALPEVTIASLGALQSGGDPVVMVGEVRSVSQAELKAQKPGEVVRVNVRAGQKIAAGTVLAEIENAQERAALLQAQGALAAAEAGLARVKNGARSEDRTSASAGAQSAAVSLAQAKESARNAYTSSYATAQNAILAQTDTFFSNPYTVRPSFNVNSALYDERRSLEDERAALTSVLDTWKVSTQGTLSDGELDQALSRAQNDLDRVRRFVDRVAFFVSKQEVTEDTTAAMIAADNALMRGAQQSLDGARASVTGARSGLASAASAATAASLNESKIVVGERPEDIRAAEAAVLQARGILAGAQATYENSLIRSPIAGTVTSLSIARGDFVTMQQQIAIVANEGASEIVTFVSDEVRTTLAPGTPVLVDGTYEGVVTSADPGLDPVTKRARITIGLPAGTTLTNGAFAEVALKTSATTTTPTKNDGWYIPIAAIKVLPNGLVLLTVNDERVLEAHPISEGTIIGDRMLVRDDLSADLMIVTDVRGRIVGEQVSVQDRS